MLLVSAKDEAKMCILTCFLTMADLQARCSTPFTTAIGWFERRLLSADSATVPLVTCQGQMC